MFTLHSITLNYTTLDIIALILAAINMILLFSGVGKLAIFGALDSVIYLVAPKLALKFNHLKYYPGIIKNADGKVGKMFQTPRDEYYPEAAPFHERLGDFIIRFPFFSLTFFILFAPYCVKFVGSYFDKMMDIFAPFTMMKWVPSSSKLFRIFIILFFLPFSSMHSMLVSIYAVFIYPLKKIFAFLRLFVPPTVFACLFALLFMLEVTLIYVGFLPLFHQGLVPFIDAGPGLKQFVFWMPIKFKVFIDLVLAPIVIVVPLITTIGSYILSRHAAGKDDKKMDYVVLFYKTGISYLYAPIFSVLFPGLGKEAKIVREERRINEVLVIGMYLESLVCVAGTAYAYISLAKLSSAPPSGIVMGILVLVVFVPLIVFSSNGFQSFFLDKTIAACGRIKELFTAGKGQVNA